MNALLQSLRNLGPVRLAAIGGVGIAILAFFVYLMSRIASPQMELLYGNLELADANQIVRTLQGEKVPYELRADGSEIWVAKERKLDLRVRMAEQSLPSGGGSGQGEGYSLFDRQDALGTTSFMQNVNLVRALEGELARTIRSINRVKSARVHLVLPKREVFSRETQEPSASVILKMDGSARLTKPQISAIQHLIASAVPKLKPHRISIVDDRGTLLARGYENKEDLMSENAQEYRVNYENRLGRTIEELLERTLGPGRVRAEVNAEIDFDRVATTQEIYDPDSRVARSEVTVSEAEKSNEGDSNSVSVSQNLPDAGLNSASGSGRSSSSQNRTQTTVNYEISKTVRNQVKELGAVKRISVAVLVDGVYTGEGAERSWKERPKEEMERIEALVRSAIGFDGNRGDQVEVSNLRFAGPEPEALLTEDLLFGMPRDLVEKVASNLGLSVVAILFLLLVLKPLVSRAIESMQPGAQPSGRLLPDSMTPQLTGPGAMPVAGLTVGPDEIEVDELIDIDKVEGRVKASSIRKIGEIVEKHPEEALAIVRNWMYQEG